MEVLWTSSYWRLSAHSRAEISCHFVQRTCQRDHGAYGKTVTLKWNTKLYPICKGCLANCKDCKTKNQFVLQLTRRRTRTDSGAYSISFHANSRGSFSIGARLIKSRSDTALSEIVSEESAELIDRGGRNSGDQTESPPVTCDHIERIFIALNNGVV